MSNSIPEMLPLKIYRSDGIVSCLFHPGGEPPANAWVAQSVGNLDNV
jgi:hypothetical protein